MNPVDRAASPTTRPDASPPGTTDSPPQRHRSQTLRRGTIRFQKFLLVLGLPAVVLILLPWDGIIRLILVYETPLKPADVVLVGGLGGELERAAELVREGYVDRILITEGIPEPYHHTDSPASLHHLIKQDLMKAGVPESLIFSLPHEPRSMADRQRMLREWIRRHRCRSYLQFSGYYASRMKKMLHDDTFPEGQVELILYVSGGKVVWRKHWLGIQNTLIRMAYWYWVCRPEFRSSTSPEAYHPAG